MYGQTRTRSISRRPAHNRAPCRPARPRRGRPAPCRSEAVHLIQAARLEARRHQEHVGAPLDQMRDRLVEPDPDANPIRMQGSEAPPHVLIARLAGAEHDEGGVEPRQLICDSRDEVEALLIDHARNHADERPRHRLLADGQAVRGEHGLLGRDLPRQIVWAVRRRQERIVGGIPLRRVDPVQDADQIAGAAPQDAVEAEPELGRLDLAGVSSGSPS